MTLLDVDPGLDPANVLTLYIGELNSRPDAERAAYYRQVLESVAAVPGVESVGINDYVPFQQEDDYEGFHVEGRPIDESYGRTEWRRVSADYFTTVGIRLLHGRAFTPADDESSPSVVVINQAFVERYFPDENPIGRRLVIHERAYAASEIVGIVADVRRRGLAVEAPPVMYVPFHRRPRPVVGLLARTDGDPRALVEPIQEAIWSVDGTQPIDRVLTMRDVLRASTAVPRLILGVIAAIAALALTLAAVGVFGVMSYAVNQRQRELAVRAALGASSAGLLSLVLGRGLKLAVAGALLGVVTGWLAIAALSRFFYAGEASHVAPYASAAILMTAVALLACYAPARRAGRAAPMQALRAE